jgi:hypothetical protein
MAAFAVLAGLALMGVLALPPGVLTLLPALTLAVVMVTRPYLGERVIERLRLRRARPRINGLGLAVRSRRRQPTATMLRGGRLIAASLAGRAPPTPACAGL